MRVAYDRAVAADEAIRHLAERLEGPRGSRDDDLFR
jgi:hypothetical protein